MPAPRSVAEARLVDGAGEDRRHLGAHARHQGQPQAALLERPAKAGQEARGASPAWAPAPPTAKVTSGMRRAACGQGAVARKWSTSSP